MGYSLLIRDRKLEFSDIFLGRVDGFWWSGADECPSMNRIKSELLLNYVCFCFIHWSSAYIRYICFVVSLFSVSFRLV
ncbi:hypothetical protein QL285_053768 [Trifolium repens]|nr:hypothetical protein QL285_053768 [Trifolium repens]